MKRKIDYKIQAKIYKALSNEARLIIIYALKNRDRTVSELTDIVGFQQSTVSRHLSILLAVGIVENQKVKNKIYYKLLTPCILEMFNCVSKVLKSQK